MKTNIDVKKLLELGAYFGHKVSRTNPKSLAYTYKAEGGIYLIDLFQTKTCIETAMNALNLAGKNQETLLVVATKRLIKDYVAIAAKEAGIFYLTEKWIGGFLTNFTEIHKNIERANTYIAEKEAGEWDKMIKHERSKLERILFKLLKVYAGVLDLKKRPQNILIIDTKKENNALKESIQVNLQSSQENKKNILIYGIVDTNANPHDVDYPMVLNDDSSSSLQYVLGNLFKAYAEGKGVKTEVKKPTSLKSQDAKSTKNKTAKK